MPYIPSTKTPKKEVRGLKTKRGRAKDRILLEEKVRQLAESICDVSIPYGYDGAFLGELNYSITRLIQLIPQIMVDRGIFKTAFRYWLYAGIAGVLIDVKDEYKRRVNTAYEAEQIMKSGDCYDTPFHTRLIKIKGKDALTKRIIKGYQEIMVSHKKFMKTTI